MKILKTIYDLFFHMFLSIVTIVFVFVYMHIYIHPISFVGFINKPSYILYSSWEQNNSLFVNEVVEYCKPFNIEDQINCVITRIGLKYNYTSRDNDNKIYFKRDIILKTDDIPYKGYVCRDIVIAYDAVFRRLGYKTDFVYTESHVYNQIWVNNMICNVDMIYYFCRGVGNE
jgi:hypothetical protein